MAVHQAVQLNRALTQHAVAQAQVQAQAQVLDLAQAQVQVPAQVPAQARALVQAQARARVQAQPRIQNASPRVAHASMKRQATHFIHLIFI